MGYTAQVVRVGDLVESDLFRHSVLNVPHATIREDMPLHFEFSKDFLEFG